MYLGHGVYGDDVRGHDNAVGGLWVTLIISTKGCKYERQNESEDGH
jgi:hypothetical protein